jgi:hypothetical protein
VVMRFVIFSLSPLGFHSTSLTYSFTKAISIIIMKCVSYDHHLAQHMTSQWEAWQAKIKSATKSQTRPGQVGKPSSQLSTCDQGDPS